MSFSRMVTSTTAALMLMLSLASPVLGHAIVIDSTPKAGSTLPAGPFEIAIRFNSRIDVGRSSLTILDAERRVTTLSVKPTTEPDLLLGLGPPLAPGKYRIRWQVLALDGHITRGDISVSVLP